MRRTRVLWEVYVTRFEEALNRYKRHRLSAEKAGELLGLSGRHFRRQCARYASAGIDGPRDKRLGRVSHRRAHEKLRREHGCRCDGSRDRRSCRPHLEIYPEWGEPSDSVQHSHLRIVC
jgi:hypothetical protein